VAGTFELEIATPERLLAKEQATEAQIPAKNGYIGVLPEHAPLLSELGAGRLTYRSSSGEHTLVVRGGFVEVLPDHVRVLTDRAEMASEIDAAEAQQFLRDAEQRVNDLARTTASTGGTEFPLLDIDAALEGLQHAQARVDSAQKR